MANTPGAPREGPGWCVPHIAADLEPCGGAGILCDRGLVCDPEHCLAEAPCCRPSDLAVRCAESCAAAAICLGALACEPGSDAALRAACEAECLSERAQDALEVFEAFAGAVADAGCERSLADQSSMSCERFGVPPRDLDDDGVGDLFDNCPGTPNPLQRDADEDTLGDACDVGDADGDGLPDRDDPCPDFRGPTPDTDGDGLGDGCDVCPRVADPDQLDADADGIGDACEIPNDDDADGVPDARDNCPRRPNANQLDPDGDGLGDVCDDCPSAPDPEQLDADGDDIGDACDVCPEVALDGENHADRDADGQPTCAGDCDDASRARRAGGSEVCDDLDNDCDGAVDEDFAALGEACAVGVGECLREGIVACDAVGRAVCDASAAAPRGEVCDALDNDCDGQTDEGLVGCCDPGEVGPCGTDVGACTIGARTCAADRSWGACDGVRPAAEQCNGVDDDCDGLTDEDLGERPCGVGACRHMLPACDAGGGPLCDPLAGASPEVCNGLDDDCDGLTDEGGGVCLVASEPLVADVSTAIRDGLAWLDRQGVFSNPSTAGDGAGLAALTLLERRAGDHPNAPHLGYAGSPAADRARLDRVMTHILTHLPPAGFASYRDGPSLPALSAYLRTGGPLQAEAEEAIALLVDRFVEGQNDDGYWCYTDGACNDTSTSQFVVAGLGAARAVFADPAYADPARLAAVDEAVRRAHAAFARDARRGPLELEESGHGYSVRLAMSYQQTAAGLTVQLLGGAGLNDTGVQGSLRWLRNRYNYESISLESGGWSQSYHTYLWSSAKAWALLDAAHESPDPGHLSMADLGVLAPAEAPAYGSRLQHRDPAADRRPARFGIGGPGYYGAPGMRAGWYYDYAYTLLSQLDAEGRFISPSGVWEPNSSQAQALLVLERSLGAAWLDPDAGLVELCNGLDDDGDGQVDEDLPDCCAPGRSEACGSDVGACVAGLRTCGADRSWGGCDAVGPVAERCNGQDDDCDGAVDEDLPPRTCGVGACLREIVACEGGAEPACDPLAGAMPEICNAIDDDCDGQADEGLPACASCDVGDSQVLCADYNPCTADACAGAGTCSFSPRQGACDDGDPLTANDRCQEGACRGDLANPPACQGTRVTAITPRAGPRGTYLTVSGCGFGNGGASPVVRLGDSHRGHGFPAMSWGPTSVTTFVRGGSASGAVRLQSCARGDLNCNLVAASAEPFTVEPDPRAARNLAAPANGARVTDDSTWAPETTVERVWDGGFWANASAAAWTEAAFAGPAAVEELWLGYASDDLSFGAPGCAVFRLHTPGGQWVEVGRTCGQPLHLKNGWRLLISPPMPADAARLELTGHGWYYAADLGAVGTPLAP